MGSRLLLFLFMSLPFHLLHGQSVAQDFTLDDCAGTSHHLFAELDQGKVIILEFAMVPACSPCIDAGHAIQTIMEEHAITHPDVVKWYAWGYNDVYTCDDMTLWESSNDLSPSATFINGTDVVSYYGGMAMPTMIVLAGTEHLVVLNEHGFIPSTQAHLENAIDAALTVGIPEEPAAGLQLSLGPNPTAGPLMLKATLPDRGALHLQAMDACGRTVWVFGPQDLSVGTHRLPVSLDALSNGAYVLVATCGTQRITLPFQVTR